MFLEESFMNHRNTDAYPPDAAEQWSIANQSPVACDFCRKFLIAGLFGLMFAPMVFAKILGG
jgi:hypothetical protein